jgi:hypothetical protein
MFSGIQVFAHLYILITKSFSTLPEDPNLRRPPSLWHANQSRSGPVCLLRRRGLEQPHWPPEGFAYSQPTQRAYPRLHGTPLRALSTRLRMNGGRRRLGISSPDLRWRHRSRFLNPPPDRRRMARASASGRRAVGPAASTGYPSRPDCRGRGKAFASAGRRHMALRGFRAGIATRLPLPETFTARQSSPRRGTGGPAMRGQCALTRVMHAQRPSPRPDSGVRLRRVGQPAFDLLYAGPGQPRPQAFRALVRRVQPGRQCVSGAHWRDLEGRESEEDRRLWRTVGLASAP